jgi:predicted MFS family arabinose efflux permease
MEARYARMHSDKRESSRPLVAGALLFSIGPVAMLVMPMIVGAYVDELGFTSRQAGWLASIEATGICVASLLGIVWVRTLNWRVVTLAGLACAGVANLLAIAADGFTPMLACRALASLGAGTAFAAATASLGEQDKPETAFGIGLAVQTLLATVIMAMSAGIMERRGIAGIFLMLALLAFVVALPVGWLRARSGKSTLIGERTPGHGSSNRARIIVGLVATVAFYAGALGFWVYLERLGNESGHSNAMIGTILAWALAAGTLGGMAPVWLGSRKGVAVPIIVATLILIGTVLMAAGKVTAPVFALSAIVFSVLWVFATTYQTALIATLDRYGGYLVLVPAAQGAGAMIGPSTASLFVRNDDYASVSMVAAALFAVSLILFLVAMRGRDVSDEPK